MTTEESAFAGVTALRNDRASGASELARRALEALSLFIEQCAARDASDLRRKADDMASSLQRARPAMASVAGLIELWRTRLVRTDEVSLAESRRQLAAAARAVADDSRTVVEAVADHVAALIPDGAALVTLSRSSTVVAAFRRLASRDVSVVACESRPLLEGHVLVSELDQLGVAGELITEAQLGLFVPHADIALVGADAVLSDGSVVNKAGTYLLALAAREADVPFWVCSESFKRSPLEAREFPLEETESSALGAPELEHFRTRNLSFDITPAHLVTRWIDERGSTVGRPR